MDEAARRAAAAAAAIAAMHADIAESVTNRLVCRPRRAQDGTIGDENRGGSNRSATFLLRECR